MNDQDKRYFQCRHCGKDISHYGGNLFHEVGVVVFPQYCTNTYPEQKSVMHEPLMLNIQETMTLSNIPGSYGKIVPSKDVKPIVVDSVSDCEVREANAPTAPMKLVVVGSGEPKMVLDLIKAVGKTSPPMPLFLPVVGMPIGEFVARFPTKEEMTKGMPLLELLDYLEPMTTSKTDVLGTIKRLQLRNEFLHPAGLPDPPIEKQYFAKVGLAMNEDEKQYPVIDLTKNNTVSVNTAEGGPTLSWLFGINDMLDLRFNVFGTLGSFTKRTDRHQVVVDKFYQERDVLVSAVEVMRSKVLMTEIPDSFISYFGSPYPDNISDPESTDNQDAVYGANCILAIYDHFGPDAPYCEDFIKAIELIQTSISEVTKQ